MMIASISGFLTSCLHDWRRSKISLVDKNRVRPLLSRSFLTLVHGFFSTHSHSFTAQLYMALRLATYLLTVASDLLLP